MARIALSLCFLLCSLVSAAAVDDTDEWWRKIDPALGIIAIVGTGVPNPPIFDAHFRGAREKEFIIHQWESETCDFSFMETCLWRGRDSNRWKRILGISSLGGEVTRWENVTCRGKIILTGWYKNDAQIWVQARLSVVSYIPYKPSVPANDISIGVVAGFEDDSGGYGTVEFIYGCNP